MRSAAARSAAASASVRSSAVLEDSSAGRSISVSAASADLVPFAVAVRAERRDRRKPTRDRCGARAGELALSAVARNVGRVDREQIQRPAAPAPRGDVAEIGPIRGARVRRPARVQEPRNGQRHVRRPRVARHPHHGQIMPGTLLTVNIMADIMCGEREAGDGLEPSKPGGRNDHAHAIRPVARVRPCLRPGVEPDPPGQRPDGRLPPRRQLRDPPRPAGRRPGVDRPHGRTQRHDDHRRAALAARRRRPGRRERTATRHLQPPALSRRRPRFRPDPRHLRKRCAHRHCPHRGSRQAPTHRSHERSAHGSHQRVRRPSRRSRQGWALSIRHLRRAHPGVDELVELYESDFS